MSTNLTEAAERAGRLPPRQRAVLVCLARGLLAKETADELSLAQGTVKNTRTVIYRKLGVNNATEATRVACVAGLV